MKLVSILSEKLVFANLKGVDRAGIYTEMLRRAKDSISVDRSSEELAAGIIEREDAIQMPYEGVALPHLRLPEFQDLHIIIGVLPKPVQMQTVDPVPCRLVVMSLISPDTSDLYLKSLAAFARFLGNSANRQALAAAGTAGEFMEVLRGADVRIRSHLTADDILVKGGAPLREKDSLSAALDGFSSRNCSVLPVVDADGRLIGEIAAADILRNFIPEYIFRMETLDFLNSFEPFKQIFQDEDTHIVRDYMRKPSLTATADAPLIQFTVKMLKQEFETCFVTDAEHRYVGDITVKDIVKKVLRG